MIKIIIASLLCLTFALTTADPAPFGLEIGKATISDLKQKYQTQHTGKNKYTGGDMYSLDASKIGIEGLNSVTAIFDTKKTLVAILTSFPKSKFDFLFNTMQKKKYKLSHKEIPFVGNKSAEFKDGKSTVYLSAPHLSFQMSLNYIDNKTYKAFTSAQNIEVQQKQRAEQAQL